ncbi:MAG: hypothetical protein IKZ92_09480 [Muribaculaceae bacterium]|nr:hypothetical protein [Muribaculaceae bacterium]
MEEKKTERQEPESSPSLNERISAMGLDEQTARQLESLTAGIDPSNVTTELLTTLAQGVTHDNDVENADAAGYLRGRNEKIEAVLHPQPDSPDESESIPVFPRYCRRSVWD